MDWVNLFSWVLPNADRERAEAHRMVGRMVVALFYFDFDIFRIFLYSGHKTAMRLKFHAKHTSVHSF